MTGPTTSNRRQSEIAGAPDTASNTMPEIDRGAEYLRGSEETLSQGLSNPLSVKHSLDFSPIGNRSSSVVEGPEAWNHLS